MDGAVAFSRIVGMDIGQQTYRDVITIESETWKQLNRPARVSDDIAKTNLSTDARRFA